MNKIFSLTLFAAVITANSFAQKENNWVSGSFGIGVAQHHIRILSEEEKHSSFFRYGLHINLPISEKIDIQPGGSYLRTDYNIFQLQIKAKYNLLDWFFLQAEPNINFGSVPSSFGSVNTKRDDGFTKPGFGLGTGIQTKIGFQVGYEYGFIHKVPSLNNKIRGNLSTHTVTFTLYDKLLVESMFFVGRCFVWAFAIVVAWITPTPDLIIIDR